LDRERKFELKRERKKEKQGIFIISLAQQLKSIKEEVLWKKIQNLSIKVKSAWANGSFYLLDISKNCQSLSPIGL
jgi:hypothetical protein